jgi:hypothetical protein
MGFGVPERSAHPLVIALVIAELLIAALLIYPATQLIGAASALGVLTLFTFAVAGQLLRGRKPSCACFGALTQSAISWKSVVRNLTLMAVAGVLVVVHATGETPALLDAASLSTFIALMWMGLSTMWLLLLTRQNGRLLLRIEQLERPSHASPAQAQLPLAVGAAVPPLHLDDTRGRPFDLRSLRGTPVLLLFLDAGCSHCQPLLTHLRDAQPSGSIALIVISESAALQHDLPIEVTVLVDPGYATHTVFGISGTPAAVSIDSNGALARPVVQGTSAVRATLDQVTTHGTEVRRELASV